jgi:riboflavin synthase
MFTGLVQHVGKVTAIRPIGQGLRLAIDAGPVAERAEIGASVCVSGCCLTVVSRQGDLLEFDLGEETLRRTAFGSIRVGEGLNLEPSLRMGDELGGHFVTGHIDGLGKVVERADQTDSSLFKFSAEIRLLRQMASKGSVAVSGVSLTLIDVTDSYFSIMLIPHTLAMTTLGTLQIGDAVHLETDILAKYVARQLGRE